MFRTVGNHIAVLLTAALVALCIPLPLSATQRDNDDVLAKVDNNDSQLLHGPRRRLSPTCKSKGRASEKRSS